MDRSQFALRKCSDSFRSISDFISSALYFSFYIDYIHNTRATWKNTVKWKCINLPLTNKVYYYYYRQRNNFTSFSDEGRRAFVQNVRLRILHISSTLTYLDFETVNFVGLFAQHKIELKANSNVVMDEFEPFNLLEQPKVVNPAPLFLTMAETLKFVDDDNSKRQRQCFTFSRKLFNKTFLSGHKL